MSRQSGAGGRTAANREEAITGLHARILACRACHQAGHLPGELGDATPIRHVWSPRQRTMIVGQAPGLQTQLKGFHFAGPGGRLLGAWLARAGYPAEGWREHCYVTSLTRCFPGKAPGGRGDRRPSPAELALCEPHLAAELELVKPAVILPVGTMAIERFLGRVALGDVVGTVARYTRDGQETPVIPLPHPSGVSRWLNDAANRARVEEALTHLASLRARHNL